MTSAQPAAPQQQPQQPTSTSAHRQKRKRPLDKNLPPIDGFISESQLYANLLNTERRLDAILTRKRLDLQEAITRPHRAKRTLRLFVSNSASDQPWQLATGTGDGMDSTEGSPCTPNWTLRIEGRLIDAKTKGTPPSRKFSTFLKSLVVNIDRDPELYPPAEQNLIEWHKGAAQPETDGFEVKRLGDENVRCQIMLKLENLPEKYKLSPALGRLLNLRYETRQQIIMGIWQYIKKHRLQDAHDHRLINTDEAMRAVFPIPQIPFPQMNELLTPHLLPMDPITIDYMVKVDQEKTDPSVFDIEVEVTDPLQHKMVAWTSHHGFQREISTLEQQLMAIIHRIHSHRLKREFMLAFANDPVHFIQRWLDSQSRDLEVLLGDHQVNLEAQRRVEFYQQPWVAEAIFHYLSKPRS